MAPRSWASPAQLVFLKSKLPQFLERQAEGKLHLFWPALHGAWFSAFPEEGHLDFPTVDAAGETISLSQDQLVTLGAAITVRKNVSPSIYI
jgi:hypothetical protein